MSAIRELKLIIASSNEDKSKPASSLTETEDGLTSKLSQSNEVFLKQKLQEIKIEKENTVKRLNFDFQTLKTKYDEDVGYFKSLLSQQTRDSVYEEEYDPNNSPQKTLMMSKIIDELRENEEHYIKNESLYKSKIAELESQVIEYENALYENENEKKYSNEERPSLDPNNKYILQIQGLNTQIKTLKTEVAERDKCIRILKEDMEFEIEKYKELESSYTKLSTKFEELQAEFKSVN